MNQLLKQLNQHHNELRINRALNCETTAEYKAYTLAIVEVMETIKSVELMQKNANDLFVLNSH